MKELWQLVRAVNANSLTVNRKKKSGKIRKNSLFNPMMLLSGLILLSVNVIDFLSTLFITKGIGFTKGDYQEYIAFFLSCFFFYGLFMSISLSVSVFYKGKDDIFLHLPISGNKIFLAKMLISFSYNLYYGGATLLTCSLISCIFLKLDIIAYLYAFLFFLLFMFFSPCFSFLVLALISKFINLRTSKKISFAITMIFALLGACLLFPVTSTSSLFPNADVITKEEALQVLNSFLQKFRFISFFLKGEAKALYHETWVDHLYLLLYLSITGIAFVLTMFVAKSSYLGTLGNRVTRTKKMPNTKILKKREMKSYRRISHPFLTKVHLELSNCKSEGSLPFYSLITSVLFYLPLMTTMISLKKEANMPPELFSAMILVFQSFSMDFSTLPYISLSINRDNIAILKTLPIQQKGDFFAKLVPAFVFYSPVYLIFTVLSLSIIGQMEEIFPFILVSLSFSLLVIFASNYLGNRFPNFNYSNVFEILKKGAGAILSRFLSTLCAIPLVVFTIVLPMLSVNRLLSYFLAFSFFFLLSILFLFLSQRSLRRFYKSDYTR